MKDKKISLVIPVLNEDENIPIIYTEVSRVIEKLKVYDFEVIFVDDGSRDNSLKEIIDLKASGGRIKYISFTRNFGKEIAMTAGLKVVSGDAAIILDADLQHPPRYIPEFIKKWEEGLEVVVGYRVVNHGANFISKMLSRIFNEIFSKMTQFEFYHGETDFRLLDRKVIDEFNKFGENDRMTRSLINWLGFKTELVKFEAPPRLYGKSSYNLFKRLNLAKTSFVAHSYMPLKIIGNIGLLMTLIFGILGVSIILNILGVREIIGVSGQGVVYLAILFTFLVGLIISCLGVMGMYIANIHNETMNRPMYVVKSKSI